MFLHFVFESFDFLLNHLLLNHHRVEVEVVAARQ